MTLRGFCTSGEAGVAAVVAGGGMGLGVSIGRVCSGGGSAVRILYRKLVLFSHCSSIKVLAGPV